MDSFSSDLTILIINAILWLIASVYLIRRYGYKCTGVVVVLFYTILAIFAIDLYINNPIGTLFRWGGISILPLLLLFCFVLLFSRLLINVYDKPFFDKPSKELITIIGTVVSVLCLLDIFEIINNFSTGLFLLATDSEYGNEIYTETTDKFVYNVQHSSSVNIIGTLATLSKGVAPMLFLVYLSYNKKNKLLVIALAFSTFTSYMYGVSMGMRSVIIQNMLSFILFYGFMKRFYSKITTSILNTVICTFFGIIIVGTALITISRVSAGNNIETYDFVESYASQGIIYLGTYGFDNGDQIRNGDRTFPLIKSVFTKDVARNAMERRNKYSRMKINESVFCTFVGDFLFDYGILGGISVMLVLFLIYKGLLNGKRQSINFGQVSIVYLLGYMLMGFYLYPLDGYAGNILFISLIFFSLWYKFYVNGRQVY